MDGLGGREKQTGHRRHRPQAKSQSRPERNWAVVCSCWVCALKEAAQEGVSEAGIGPALTTPRSRQGASPAAWRKRLPSQRPQRTGSVGQLVRVGNSRTLTRHIEDMTARMREGLPLQVLNLPCEGGAEREGWWLGAAPYDKLRPQELLADK